MHKVYFLCLNPIQFVPYAYGTLRSYCEQNPTIYEEYQWIPPIWRFEPIVEILQRIREPAILCASCYVWNHNHHCAIAQRIKQKFPQCRVIFGGPHVPVDNSSYFQDHPYVDILVHNEGELSLEALLVEFLKGNPSLENIPGLSINQKGTCQHTKGSSSLPKDLPIPSPYLEGVFESFFAEITSCIALWETNRGCPYSCSFCDWGVRTRNRLRLHSFDKAAQEIEYIARNKIEDIYITDCNFGILKRDLEFAKLLVQARNTHGYPHRVRIQFAKTSNDTVFEISRLLHENNMLWGTTLSMQSADMDVLQAVHRKQIGIEHYKALKKRYDKQGIPTYTELILGLPTESLDSFVNGICSLFEIGIHNDIRVFELNLLPNAPISRPENRKYYRLQTGIRPIRLVKPGQVREDVELVFATNSMSAVDWVYCFVFAEFIQALHNGGYTQFLARYLYQERKIPYRNFYQGLLHKAMYSDNTCFKGLQRIQQLILDFQQDQDMPQVHRLLTQPDIMSFLDSYNPNRQGWQPWTYLWLWLAEYKHEFYLSLQKYLLQLGLNMDATLEDLLNYQEELMISLGYDPDQGKCVSYTHNWFGYFFLQEDLQARQERLYYTDKYLGVFNRFVLQKNNRFAFTRAAIGISYPYSKLRHFFHQPENTVRLSA